MVVRLITHSLLNTTMNLTLGLLSGMKPSFPGKTLLSGPLNATTIRFNEAPEDNQRILIYRRSGIDPLPATFYPGTSIKAQDLNENFFVLKNAVEEAKCEASKKSLDSNTLVTELETINGEWVDGDLNTDSRVPTAAATPERLDPIFEDLLPDPQNWRLPGRRWFDADSTKTMWDQVNGVWVEAVASGVPGPPGPAFYNFCRSCCLRRQQQ